MLGARLEETILFRLWSSEGVEFVKDQGLSNALRYQGHQNGNLIHFYYFSDANWSKARAASTEGTMTPKLIEQMNQIFPGKKFLFLSNNMSDDIEAFSNVENSTRLPAFPHGQNQFKDKNNVIVTAAYNSIPGAAVFLRDFCGISREDQKIAMMNHMIYHGIYRCSIRDPENLEEKHIVLPDEFTALWCQDVFPGSTCQKLDLDLAPLRKRGRKQIHKTITDKKKASRRKIRLQKEQALKYIDMDGVITCLEDKDKIWDEYTIIDQGINVPTFRGTLIGQKLYDVHGVIFTTEDEFVAILTELAKRPPLSKDKNNMISPGLFDIYATNESNTGEANVVLASGIWLDLDDTNISKRNFADLFPHLKLFIYETHSSTPENLRYRVYIPTNEYMNRNEYRSIVKQIISYVAANGYSVRKHTEDNRTAKCHGIDPKLSPSDKFLLPCQTKDGRNRTYHYYNGSGRAALNVADWIGHPIQPAAEEEIERSIPEPIVCGRSDELTPQQRMVIVKGTEAVSQADPGDGRRKFYCFHLMLKHAGVMGMDWETAMQEAAFRARSPDKRLKQIRELKKLS